MPLVPPRGRELGQPDESRIRKAASRARQVVVVNYGGRASDVWWDKNAATLRRFDNVTVLDVPADAVDALVALYERSMRLNVLIQDGEVQLMGERGNVDVRVATRMAATAPA